MPVVRIDLNACVGCENCYTVCPRDVFRFDSTEMKSIIAYPKNCQNCGQCFAYCMGKSIDIDGYTYRNAFNSFA